MAGCKPRWYQNHYKTVNNAKTRSRLACFVRIACEVASYIRALDAVVVLQDSRKSAVGRTRRYCSTIMPKIKDLHCVLSMMISSAKKATPASGARAATRSTGATLCTIDHAQSAGIGSRRWLRDGNHRIAARRWKPHSSPLAAGRRPRAPASVALAVMPRHLVMRHDSQTPPHGPCLQCHAPSKRVPRTMNVKCEHGT